MLELPITLDVKIDDRLIAQLDTTNVLLRELIDAIKLPLISFEVRIPVMKTYKDNHDDFTLTLQIVGKDAEGRTIKDAPIPDGHTLTLQSDSPGVFSVTPIPENPKSFSCHVEGPNEGEESSQANLTATLTNADGNLVASGVEQVVVTLGDLQAITSINIPLPD